MDVSLNIAGGGCATRVFLMMKRVLLLLLLLITGICVPMEVVFGQAAANGNGTSVSSSSSPRPSVANIGSLFTFDSVIGRAAGPAIAAAVDDVNSDPTVLPGTRLNLISHNTNCSGFLGTVEGISSSKSFSRYYSFLYLNLGFLCLFFIF
jgi:ionotropic glutamate receptor